MSKDTVSPKEPEVAIYGPDFFTYRKLYGDPPSVIETFKPIGQLWGFQEAVINLASGRRSVMTETQIHDALRENGMFTQRATVQEIALYEASCRPLQSIRKSGEYLIKIATPEDYTQYYGVTLRQAQHMAWRDLGHEGGHGADWLWCKKFFKNVMMSHWGSEVRQWHFNLRYAHAIGDNEWINRGSQFFQDIESFRSVIKVQK